MKELLIFIDDYLYILLLLINILTLIINNIIENFRVDKLWITNKIK